MLWLGALAIALACGDPNDPQPTIGSLSGTVRDAATDAPIEGATVVVAGVEGHTASDGSYEIDSVPVGTHRGTVSMAGYVAQTFEAEIRTGAVTSVALELAAAAATQLTITTSALPAATADLPYEVALEATGGTPPYVWGASDAAPGLVVTADGLVTGTPGYPAGSYTLSIGVRDAESARASVELTLEVQTASGLRALGGQLSSGEFGVPYSEALGAQGGAPPYTFELVGLPAGLDIGPATGVVSGIPTGATGPEGEPIDLELVVRDVVGASAFAPVSIGIVPGPLVLVGELPDGQIGIGYEAYFESSGGFGTHRVYTVISGSLPPGLGIAGPESLYGPRLHGHPTLAGTYQFTVQLSLCPNWNTEDCTPQIATKEYEVTIAGSSLSVVTSSLPDADVGTGYSVFLVRDGGAAPFLWDVVSGSLPAGVTLTAAGELTGTPSAAGDFSFEVRVRDAGNQSATGGLTLHVEP